MSFTTAIVSALLVVAAEGGAEVRVDRAAFPATLAHEGTSLSLAGAGLFRWGWVVKVYAAAHYVGEGAPARDVAADVPRRLEIAYFVSIAGPEFGKAADAILGERLAPAELASLRDRLDALHGAYLDVKPGDRYALTYVPGRGTELALNGRRLAVVEGADFARAYFSIWLGERPIDGGLRAALIGG